MIQVYLLMYVQVVNWREHLQIPLPNDHIRRGPLISSNARDLIKSLCCDASDRLGRNGANGIKQHPYFHNINFDTLRSNKAHYIPDLRDSLDTSHFESVDYQSPRGMDIENGSLLTDCRLQMFCEFTFRRFFDHYGHPLHHPVLYDGMIPEVQEDDSQPGNSPAIYV